MRSLKILSIGFLVSILVAASAFPVGETSPNGIEPGVQENSVIANGCSCHNIGDGDMNNPNPEISLLVKHTL